jgi:hypothetical protein
VGPHGRPVAWEGPAAVAALDLASAVHLAESDILWVPGLPARDPAAVCTWLANEAESPGSRLEQVFLARPPTGRRGRQVRVDRAGGT